MFLFFNSRMGCAASLVVSIVITLVILFVVGVLRVH